VDFLMKPELHRLESSLIGTPRRAVVTSFALTATFVTVVLLIPGLTAVLGLTVPAVAAPTALLVGRYPNECKQALGRALTHVAWASKAAERESVRQDIEGTLSLGIQQVGETLPGLATPLVRLEYIQTAEQLDRLADGAVVIGIANHENRERNLIAAAITYIRVCVIPEARPHLDPDVSDSLDFVLAKELLANAGPATVREFLASVWRPAIVGRDRLKDLAYKMERLHADRLLGPIVLAEFNDLAVDMGMRFPADEVARETGDFVDYLYSLAVREPGADVGDGTNFDGGAIRCRVVFVARPTVYEVKGPSPYRAAVDWAVRRAYHRVYVLASGRNIEFARDVVEPFHHDRRIKAVTEFVGTRTGANGRTFSQLVIRVDVFVKYRVGIGQRPVVAVGPGVSAPASGRKARRAG
jgi:hypothetical protein